MSGRTRSKAITAVPSLHRQALWFSNRRLGDGSGALLILAFTLISASDFLRRPGRVVSSDVATFFLPMYSFLGERLRAGDVPGWNPHQFTGAPFAGDPESGWMYLPAMVLFAALPPTAAIVTHAVFHLALAGLATYALARALGLGVPAALVVGVVYGFTWMPKMVRGALPYVQVAAWLPLALLGAELALRSRTWTARLGWWATAGFAVSQILGAWLGQGAYYALLAFGCYVTYRTLLAPPLGGSLPVRLGNLALHGAAMLTLSFALAAAGLLPRLEYNARSNLAGGVYQGEAARAAERGGWSLGDVIGSVLGGNPGLVSWYAGGAALALAIIAPLVARRWFAIPYCMIVSVAALVLALDISTPLHTAAYALLPKFETLHSHRPERILLVFPLGIALLAGATVDHLIRWRRRAALVIVALMPAVVLLIGPALLDGPTSVISHTARAAVFATVFLLIIYALAPAQSPRQLVSSALLLVVLWDPAGQLLTVAREQSAEDIKASRTGVAAFVEPTGAVRFLDSAGADGVARYIGYGPELLPASGFRLGYRNYPRDPPAPSLLVNNRATLFGLDDIQGYNPVRLQRYVDFVTTMNGRQQNYHEANVFPQGLSSPLFDLLNVRYVVVPAEGSSIQSVRNAWGTAAPVAYEDAQVRVLENREAMPRAWIVHEAKLVAPGEALPLLASGTVDPRQTALLEEAPPTLAAPDAASIDEAAITTYEPDRVQLLVRTDAPGLLVLSDAYDPAWQTRVDGEPVPLYVVNHALRAVAVPAGAHEVDMRYESGMLHLGLAISGGAYAALAGFVGAVTWQKLGRGWRGTFVWRIGLSRLSR